MQVSNSDRSLKSLRGFQYETLDDQEKQQVTRMIASVQGMGSRKYEPESVDHLEDMTEPVEMEIYLGNGDESVGGDFGDIVLEPISWPLESQLNLEWVETLMGLINQFTWKNSVSEFPLILPHSVAFSLVECASQILDKEANCVKIDCCSENSRVIVVGDLHGQLHDLLKIFDQSGRPSQNQCFVFNGNYIGRGSWSLEVFLVLLAWKVHI